MPRRAVRYLVDAVRRPSVELTRRQRQLRSAWELGAHCLRVLQHHRAEGMAAELTYRTIFSLIPLAVLGLVTFRTFGGLDKIENEVENQLYNFFGVPDIPEPYFEPDDITGSGASDVAEVSPSEETPLGQFGTEAIDQVAEDQAAEQRGAAEGAPGGRAAVVDRVAEGERPEASDEAGDVDAETEAERRKTQASIRWVLRELINKVAELDFASIGVFGLLLFIYAAIALADSVESIFNLIYEAPSGRPIHLRVAIHWSIITLGSGLLAMSLYMSGRLVAYVSAKTGLSATVYIEHGVAMLSGWVLLFLLYALMPNTKVSVRAAAIGALVASALWEVAKLGFQFYVATALPYSALYGSLGLIPLFLFWVYITWFIFLFGLVWTYTLQTARGHVPTKEEDEVDEDMLLADPQWLLLLMIEASEAFERGEAIDRQQLQERLGLPVRVLQPLVCSLTQAGLLRCIETEQGDEFVPARPPEKITASEILRAGRYTPTGLGGHSWKVLERLREQLDAELHAQTLRDLSRSGAAGAVEVSGGSESEVARR